MNRKVFIRLIVITGGIGIILLSFFAFQLGLDNDPGWGPRRIQLVGIGLAIILFGSLYWITPIVGKAFSQTSYQNTDPGGLQTRSTKKINNIWLILVGCLVFWMYVWIITIGRMDKWPSGRDYYWLLAQAFRQGQTHLLVEPNPALAKLGNPYDHHQRRGLEYLWDTTYYDGKYFLYWGPVPAVIGVFVSSVTSKSVTDTGLVFSFVIGTALFSIWLLKDIYKEYKYPAWVFWGGALASVVNVPLTWLLTRPTFYEVSISGGQFFLMAGFFALLRAFRSTALHKGYLTFSAAAFGLAGATRINLLPSVVILAIIIIWRIYVVNQKKIKPSLPAFTAVLVPLALIACSLLWYNYDRFGSIFEFGHRYQLTGPSLTADYKDISSIKYIVPNLYTYVFRLPVLDSEFPFFTIPAISEDMWPSFIHLPEHYYYTEAVAGILFIIPLVGLTALLLARIFWLFINGDISYPKRSNDFSRSANTATDVQYPLRNSSFSWFGFSMLAYILIQTIILMIFINSAIRYLLDISPALIVLSTMFVGYYVNTISQNLYEVRLVSFLWVLASLLTVLAGFLIGFTGNKNNFLNQNPQLYYQLFDWFSH